jgi:hypothetical protein
MILEHSSYSGDPVFKYRSGDWTIATGFRAVTQSLHENAGTVP